MRSIGNQNWRQIFPYQYIQVFKIHCCRLAELQKLYLKALWPDYPSAGQGILFHRPEWRHIRGHHQDGQPALTHPRQSCRRAGISEWACPKRSQCHLYKKCIWFFLLHVELNRRSLWDSVPKKTWFTPPPPPQGMDPMQTINSWFGLIAFWKRTTFIFNSFGLFLDLQNY